MRFLITHFAFRPKSIEIFKQAVTHKSLQLTFSNERLEFLGDAILDAVMADILFHKFPEEDEGYLTTIKSKIVNRKTLGEIGQKMGLREHIKFDDSRSINLATLEGNAFEALIGALYLDGGYEQVKKSLQQHILVKYINIQHLMSEENDFKSRLIIFCQKKRRPLHFGVINESQIKGEREYTVQIKIDQEPYGQGKAGSKKQAEQMAAKQTLELIGEL